VALANWLIKEAKDGTITSKAATEAIKAFSPEDRADVEYLTNASQLVYATALFDTFLSDLTRLLLLLFPQVAGKKTQITLEALLGSRSRTDLLNDTIEKKVREISFLPFAGRLAFFDEQFGVKTAITQGRLDSLEQLSDLRNKLVHDQSTVSCRLTAKGNLQVKQRSMKKHLARINEEDVKKGVATYESITKSLARAIGNGVLKINENPAFRKKDLRKNFGI
jgi:hypothetical protein